MPKFKVNCYPVTFLSDNKYKTLNLILLKMRPKLAEKGEGIQQKYNKIKQKQNVKDTENSMVIIKGKEGLEGGRNG